jgi:hypothetical protein
VNVFRAGEFSDPSETHPATDHHISPEVLEPAVERPLARDPGSRRRPRRCSQLGDVMRSANRVLMVIACLAVSLAVAGGASAQTLQDLTAPGASFSAGGVTYDNFDVKIKGKGLSRDLTEYYIVPTGDGFALEGEFSEMSSKGKAKGGKIKLTYDATGIDLLGAGLAIDGGSGSDGKLKVKEKLSNGKKIDTLKVSFKKSDTSDSTVLNSLPALSVKETIRIKGDYFLDGSDSSVTHSFTSPVPEPTTGLMLALGLAGLAAKRRSRSR